MSYPLWNASSQLWLPRPTRADVRSSTVIIIIIIISSSSSSVIIIISSSSIISILEAYDSLVKINNRNSSK